MFIDNSINVDDNLATQIKSLDSKITYLNNGYNQGIANALNIGAQEAFNAGYKWLLTMDQDSKFEDINSFFECCKKYTKSTNVAIFAPSIDVKSSNKNCGHKHPKVVITSGNLVRLKYYQCVGGFESKLFIDEIDHDFCLKLGERHLVIVQFSHISLHHSIGEEMKLTSLIFRRHKFRRIHNYKRIYYQTRNRLYMAKRHSNNYPEAFSFGAALYKVIYKKGIRIIQWEPDKLRKLKAMCHGVYDYLNDNYGVYDADSHH